MKKSIGVKNAFTLVEMMVVLILVGIIAFIAISSFQPKKEKEYKVKLENLKEFLEQKFKYEDQISFICVEEENLPCYVFIDNNEKYSVKIQNLFYEIPKVYKYGRDLNPMEFLEVKIDDISYNPFFELTINKDKKHKNIVLDTLDEKVYLIKSISNNIEVYKSTDEILDEFDKMEIEVKDAL